MDVRGGGGIAPERWTDTAGTERRREEKDEKEANLDEFKVNALQYMNTLSFTVTLGCFSHTHTHTHTLINAAL